MPLGLYTPFVEGIGHVRPEVLLPGVAGCVVTFICLAKLVNRLFERQYAVMFHGIFGIVGAATVMTVPWGSFATSADAASRNLFCMAAGIVAAILLDFMNENWHVFPKMRQNKIIMEKEGRNMQMYAVVATGVLGLLIGFWSGRSIRWNMEETEEEAVNRQEERRITGNRQLVMEGTAIGSPVNGEIRKISQDTLQDTTEEAEDDNTKCITILPSDGRVYAPTAGKVLKLYPMGNRIRFRTDSGVELLLNICRDKEELHSAYYRCNVLPNEIVRKGKLLVEFDQEGLAREGVDTAVTVEMCQTPERGRIVRTWKDYIRAGEELLWVDSVCLR